MSYGIPRKFNKVGEIKAAWDEYVKPYITEENGVRQLKNKNIVPTDFMFARFCDCSYETLYNYASKSKVPYGKFNAEMAKIKTDYIAIMADSSLQGNNNANFFLSRKLGFIEKQEIDVRDKTSLIDKFEGMDTSEIKELMRKKAKEMGI